MKFLFERDTWQEVYDSVTKNKVRTVITMIGVWWGILLLIALLGAARGMENSFNRIFGDFATNSVFIWGQNTSIPFKGFQEGKRVELKLSYVDKIIDNIEGVELVVPRTRNQALVVHNFQSGNYGINGDYPILDKIQKKKMLQGRFINQNDISEKRKVAVVSDDIYKQLFEKDENSIGNYIQINSTNFKVIGSCRLDGYNGKI
jgi:putative ABC transport system permease protein